MPDGSVSPAHPRPHPDLAGWVLGALDTDDADTFERHLQACDDCRAEVAELERLPALLSIAAPPVELPGDLEERTLAAVQRAAGRRRGRRFAQLGMAAAACVALVAVLTLGNLGVEQQTASFALAPVAGGAMRADAQARKVGNGWEVDLTAFNLPPGRYECWYTGPGDQPGTPNRISAGTFKVEADGRADVRMTVAVSPLQFTRMEISKEPEADGNPAMTGTVVLSGEVSA
jgi:anti-sigma-K factor RskA